MRTATLLLATVCTMTASEPKPITAGGDPAAVLLRELAATGTVAGNDGDRYQNCDGFHADNLDKPRLKPAINVHPQVTKLDPIHYPSGEAMAAAFPPAPTPFGPPTLWNSSEYAGKGMSWSNWCVSEQAPAERSHQAYRNNVLCLNPALWDYAWRSSYQDRKPATGSLPCGFQTMSPYMIASRGHSHSEGGLMRDIWYGLAALRPEVKQRLIATGHLMPTMQMVFRRARVDSDAEYLSAAGNPFAFLGDEQYLGPGEKALPRSRPHRGVEMIRMANAITVETLPPLVQLTVSHDGFPASAVMSTTPGAIARRMPADLAAGAAITVSASDSVDLNRRPLTFTWAVLYGPAESVTLKADGAQAQISFKPIPAFTIADGDLTLDCKTMVVACWAHNGAWYSAPAFITCTMLTPDDAKGPGPRKR